MSYLRITDLDPIRRDCHPADAIVCRPERIAAALLESGWLGGASDTFIRADITGRPVTVGQYLGWLQRALVDGRDIAGMQRALGIAIEPAGGLIHANADSYGRDSLQR